MNQAFGIMDQGYFISRTQILDWINKSLKLNITKIEQLGSGAVYCQILDMMFPNSVAMSQVKFNVKHDYEFINNLKILQNSFTQAGIQKVVQIEKLCKCKYQDNLEMIQWMKRFYDQNGGCQTPDYDPESRRKGETDFSFAEQVVVPQIYNSVPDKSSPQEQKQRPQTAVPKQPSVPSVGDSKQNIMSQPQSQEEKQKDSTTQGVGEQQQEISSFNKEKTTTSNTQAQQEELENLIKGIFADNNTSDTDQLKAIANLMKIQSFKSVNESPSQMSTGSDGSVF